MFTTQIGPRNLSGQYLTALQDCLERNLQQDDGLVDILNNRTGFNNVAALQEGAFEDFFKLSVPKILASTMMDEDWHVDPKYGISIFEFERPSIDGPYKILHLVMDVKRHNPPKEQRVPGTKCDEAEEAYWKVVRQIFSQAAAPVSLEGIDKAKLQADLERIKTDVTQKALR